MIRVILSVFLLLFSSAVAQEPVKPTGPAEAAPIYPLDAVIDGEGNAWVVDLNQHGVWKHHGDQTELAIQGSKKFREKLYAARCLAISPDGKLHIGDTATREVYRVGANNELEPTVSGLIGIPLDLAFAADGTMYVADAERRVVWSVKPGAKPEVFADANPRGLFVDTKNQLWVVSQGKEQILRYAPDKTKTVIVGERVFEFPHQIVVDSQGTAWVSDGYKKAIWKIADGQKPEIAIEGSPLLNPVGLALLEDKPIIVDPRAQKVLKLIDGKLTDWFSIPVPTK